MKFELMTVVSIQGVPKTPITVLVNHKEIDIDHRVNLIVDCYKRAHKFDTEITKEQKAAVLHLLEVMRAAIHGGARVVPPTFISENDVALEYRIYQSLIKDED